VLKLEHFTSAGNQNICFVMVKGLFGDWTHTLEYSCGPLGQICLCHIKEIRKISSEIYTFIFSDY